MSERPTFGPIWLACKRCKHAWDDWQPRNVPIETWAAHVMTYRCPQCDAGKGDVLLRMKPLDGEPG
jgi:hypothetical protein